MTALLLALLATTPQELSLSMRRDAGPPVLSRTPLPFVWELPPKVLAQIPIDGISWVDGIPVRLQQLIVEGKPEDIGLFYLESFKRQGLYVAPGQAIDKLFSAVDPESIITYSVVVQKGEGGRVTVVLGEAHPLERKGPAKAGLPMMPGAAPGLPVQMEGYLQLDYSVAASPAEVTAFYARELGAKGWQLTKENHWEQAGEQVELSQRTQGSQQRVTLRRAARRAE